MNQQEGLDECRRRFPGLVELEKRFPWPAENPKPPYWHGERGWMPTEVQSGLIHFSAPSEPRVYLELGVWLGLSMRTWLGHTPMGIGIGVDTWLGTEDHRSRPDLKPLMPVLYETFMDESWLYRDRLIPLKMTSIEGMQLVHDMKISPNLIYIDADHTYDCVRADFSMARDLFPGAMIMGDDYLHPESHVFGVHRAVNDVAREKGLVIHNNGHCWWIGYP